MQKRRKKKVSSVLIPNKQEELLYEQHYCRHPDLDEDESRLEMIAPIAVILKRYSLGRQIVVWKTKQLLVTGLPHHLGVV